MQAAWCEQRGPAGEVLTVAEIDAPEPEPGEVRVRVALAGINPGDVRLRVSRGSRRLGVAMPM